MYFAIVELGVHHHDKVCIKIATPGQVLGNNNHLYGSTVKKLGYDPAVYIGEALM